MLKKKGGGGGRGGSNGVLRSRKHLTNSKRVMSEVPTLGLPNFSYPFILETDASANGIGVILVQEDRTLAFLNQALSS